MMSRHCFFKILKEDFRHKTWMLALSILGNLLAFPVALLLELESRGEADVFAVLRQVQGLQTFFEHLGVITGGVIAVAGALIVGLFGFRHVFHRNMSDTYNSLPVRRRTLFITEWLNGFLIWFIPFLVSLSIALAYGVSRLAVLKGKLAGLPLGSEGERLAVANMDAFTVGSLVMAAMVSILALLIAFLLTYNLALFAVMLCGNMLNTLGVTAVLGGGALSVYGLLLGMHAVYFDTFLSEAATGYRQWVYASPLASAVVLLNQRILYSEGLAGGFGFRTALAINLCVALGLGLLAFLAYIRRPSELAEQGVRSRLLRFLIQITVTLAASMGGWLLFYAITNTLAWPIFGALLAGCIVFGVLDIVFNMDFKAFFDHKVLMGVTTAAGVLIGLTFYYDWMGFDTYLPKEDEIAEISLYDNIYTNTHYAYYTDILSADHPLNRAAIRDSGAAYRFLKAAVETTAAVSERRAVIEADPSLWMSPVSDTDAIWEIMTVRCQLKNGRTYYRQYNISSENSGLTLALLASKEYLDVNYRIGEERSAYDNITLLRGDLQQSLKLDTPAHRELPEELCEAYNRDLEENPEAFIRGDQRLFCSILLSDDSIVNGSGDDVYDLCLEVYECMQYTREVLRRYGYQQFADPIAAEDVEEIRLWIEYWDKIENPEDPRDPVEAAADWFGVRLSGDVGGGASGQALAVETGPAAAVDMKTTGAGLLEVRITDAAQIRELLGLLSYDMGRYRGETTVRTGRVSSIELTIAGQEETVRANVLAGAVPEKYIMRFAAAEGK